MDAWWHPQRVLAWSIATSQVHKGVQHIAQVLVQADAHELADLLRRIRSDIEVPSLGNLGEPQRQLVR